MIAITYWLSYITLRYKTTTFQTPDGIGVFGINSNLKIGVDNFIENSKFRIGSNPVYGVWSAVAKYALQVFAF